jgi:hypothetical protein
MKNAGMAEAIALVGLGLMSIGFNPNGNQANATPAAPVAFNAGQDLPGHLGFFFWQGLSSQNQHDEDGNQGETSKDD